MTEKNNSHQDEWILPPVDNSSLILPFYTQALVCLEMGGKESPESGARNIHLAKRMIELIELFKDKTRGNLSDEESHFLNKCLRRLRSAYTRKSNSLKM